MTGLRDSEVAARSTPSERLRGWVDGIQLSNRLGVPHYANPGELKADLREVLNALDRVRSEADIVLANRNAQLERLAERLAVKETALQRIMDAVSLAEAKQIAREAIRVV